MLAATAADKPRNGSVEASSHLVRPNDTLMLKLSNGGLRTVVAKPNSTIALGKLGSFPASAILGKPFGLTYEIVAAPPAQDAPTSSMAVSNGKNKKQEKEATTLIIKDDLPVTNADQVENEVTNEHISADVGAQRLTMEEIQKLVESGADGRSIVAKQIAEHSAFEMKNSHSKQKYIAKKESKYIKYFTLLSPSPHNVCDIEFQSRGLAANLPSKIRELRPDTLAQILALANVHPDSRVMCCEDASGLLIGSLLYRMAGQGQLLQLHDAESPPSNPVLPPFNLSKRDMRPHQWVHWAMTDKDYEPVVQGETLEEITPEMLQSMEPAEAKKLDKERKKSKKRNEQLKDVAQRRDLYSAGQWEALVISSPFELSSMIEHVLPVLAGSANLVVHSPVLSPLTDLQQYLTSHEEFTNITVFEPFLRNYQVFPGRTHPNMNGTASGGFVLHAIRVFTNDAAISARARSHAKRKAGEVSKDNDDEASKKQRVDRNADSDVRPSQE